MNECEHTKLAEAVELLTGFLLPAHPGIEGRNVWGRVRFHTDGGMIHVEALPGDREISERVGRTIGPDEMKIESRERYKLFRSRCCAAAAEINRAARDEGRLTLLVSSNGHLTQAAKVILKVLA